MNAENKTQEEIDIENKVKQVKLIISELLHTKLSEIKSEDKIKDLGADSLDVVEIIMKIEEVFNIEIQEKDFEKTETIQQMAKKIHELKKSKESNSK